MWNQITVEDCISFPVNLLWFWLSSFAQPRQKDCRVTRGINLEYRKTLLGYQFSTFDSSPNHYLGIHRSTTPSATGTIPVYIGTETLSRKRWRSKLRHDSNARHLQEGRRSWVHYFQWIFCTTLWLDSKHGNFSELQFDKFTYPQSFSVRNIRFKNQATICAGDARHRKIESEAVTKSRKGLSGVEGGKGICYQWKEKGQCSQGDRCSFRHEVQDRAQKPEHTAAAPLSQPFHEGEVCRGREAFEAKSCKYYT